MDVTIRVETTPLKVALEALKTRADKAEFLRIAKRSEDVFKLRSDSRWPWSFILEPSDALTAFLSGNSPQMVRAELEGIR